MISLIVGRHNLLVDDPAGGISVPDTVCTWAVLAVLCRIPIQSPCRVGVRSIVAIFPFVFIASLVVWFIIKLIMGICLPKEDEYIGVDISECGLESYPEFSKKT